MLSSIAKYSVYFLASPFIGDARKIVAADFISSSNKLSFHQTDKELGLDRAAEWLLNSQDTMEDEGFGSYHLIKGWTTSYPETSGYIIETLLNYANRNSDQKIVERCIRCADWLVNIQKTSGGWQSMTVAHNKPEVVFNTGQVIRGVFAVYLVTKESKYLEAIIRAMDWLCDIQESNGAWRTHAFMNVERVYDSYVSAPMLMVSKQLNNERYFEHAVRNLNWIATKQKKNGWFEDCDNTLHKNHKPILHTIAYTIDGLLDGAEYSGEDQFFMVGRKPAEVLLDQFLSTGKLYGRYDSDWNGSEDTILTGCAQISICWMKIFKKTGEEQFFEGAIKMNNWLLARQYRTNRGSKRTRGAITGSSPVWGRYESFSCPNWATKYFMDAIMMELSLKNASD